MQHSVPPPQVFGPGAPLPSAEQAMEPLQQRLAAAGASLPASAPFPGGTGAAAAAAPGLQTHSGDQGRSPSPSASERSTSPGGSRRKLSRGPAGMAIDAPAEVPFTLNIPLGHWAGGPTTQQMQNFCQHLENTLAVKFGEVYEYLRILHGASDDSLRVAAQHAVQTRMDQVEASWQQKSQNLDDFLTQHGSDRAVIEQYLAERRAEQSQLAGMQQEWSQKVEDALRGLTDRQAEVNTVMFESCRAKFDELTRQFELLHANLSASRSAPASRAPAGAAAAVCFAATATESGVECGKPGGGCRCPRCFSTGHWCRR